MMTFEIYRDLVQFFLKNVHRATYSQLITVFNNSDYLFSSVGQLIRKGVIKINGKTIENNRKVNVFEFIG
jgi:23S rRNA-/tRNA-specific pseudouridylate synthase